MSTYSPLVLLAALGALGISAPAAAVDTSAWKCESCPYPKGASGYIDVGVGAVSDESAKYGDFTGLDQKGTHLVLGGKGSYRSDSGYYADLAASDLGLDSRSLSLQSGREGLYSLRLGLSELPRHFADGAQSPFLGIGSGTLTLPVGYPSANTSTMFLATTLRPVSLGFERKRYDIAGSWIGVENWTYRMSLRRDVREGTRPLTSSFFSTAVQMAAPVNHETDQLEVSASYAGRALTATLSYLLSEFKNYEPSLTWANPFLPAVVADSTRGRLALAPSNTLQQFSGQFGYEISPMVRASAEFSTGRLAQNEAYLASTLTPSLAATVAPLPATSLDGHVNTTNGALRLTATPIKGLRINASWTRDERDNRTGVASYPMVITDLALGLTPRSNTPFTFKQDRYKLSADYRGPGALRVAVGAEQDNRQRNYSEVVDSRETTVWWRMSAKATDELSLAFKAEHAERSHTAYGSATWFAATENPLMRKFNLAARQRDKAGVRADATLFEIVSVGLSADYANDDYTQSIVGLTAARNVSMGADVAVSFSEQTQLTAFAQGERIRSQQVGSQVFGQPDWWAQSTDRFEVFGLSIKHAAIPDKLEIGAEVSSSSGRSDLRVATVVAEPPFPGSKTSQDTARIFATYKLQDNLWLNGSLRHDRYDAQDWRVDGIAPSTLVNLLSLGAQSPRYNITLLQLAVRYRF